jgi:hypothetical protein
MHDISESQGHPEEFRGNPELLQELNLDVSTEELLGAEGAFTYANLYDMLGNGEMVAWLTPHVAVARRGAIAQSWTSLWRHFYFNADGKEIVAMATGMATSPEHSFEICDLVLRLLAASVAQSVSLFGGIYRGASINAPTLAYLMERCQTLEMDENHCHVLGDYSRPGLEIELKGCKLTSAGTSALAEVLGRNQGPTNIDCLFIDYAVLANGLRENSHLKRLTPDISGSLNLEDHNRQLLAIAGALQENKGLIRLDLRGRRFGLRVSDKS